MNNYWQRLTVLYFYTWKRHISAHMTHFEMPVRNQKQTKQIKKQIKTRMFAFKTL